MMGVVEPLFDLMVWTLTGAMGLMVLFFVYDRLRTAHYERERETRHRELIELVKRIEANTQKVRHEE